MKNRPPSDTSAETDPKVELGVEAAGPAHPSVDGRDRAVTGADASRLPGTLLDEHELTERARRYARDVITGDEWPLDGVELSKLSWSTSARAKRRHGRCRYLPDGECEITLSEHTYDRAGFGACKETVRHELVHAWQHQHEGRAGVVGEEGIRLLPEGADAKSIGGTVRVETGHGETFRAWLDPLALQGRRSHHYEKRRSDYAYVYECPKCGGWWGRHRLCKSVRQAAHGGAGGAGYRYCTDCDALLYLRSGSAYLDHGPHDDAAIRAFADGDRADLPTVAAAELDVKRRPGEK